MTKLTLVALAVICSRPTGYRRAGFSLDQGENQIKANKEQYDALSADKHLTVSIESDNSEFLTDDSNNNGDLEDQVTYLKNTNSELEKTIVGLRKELAEALVDKHQDTFEDLAGVGDRTFGFDCSSAPIELHHFIAVIDDLNKETPLTRKPNCDHLQIKVEGKIVKPTGEQRDAAWAWYENNVKIVEADDVNSESNTETEA